MMSKTALVTGCAGFLGSHMCDSLIADGYHVIGIDNLSTGSMWNVAHLNSKDFTFYKMDIVSKLDVLRSVQINEIWNFACPASPPKYQEDPVHTFMTSVMGVANLLEVARVHNAKFFQSSTSEIYGDPLVSEQKESYWGNVNTVGPRSCYDEGKRAAETLITDYSKQYNVPVKIVRIFNTYGPRMNKFDGRVITNFITQALADEKLTVYGKGEQTRSFCYVTDAIRGYRALMDTPDEFIEPVNIGNPNEFKIADVATMICDKIPSASYKSTDERIVFCPTPIDDPRQRKPDITKAKTILGWEPKVQIDEGLDYMIEFYKGK